MDILVLEIAGIRIGLRAERASLRRAARRYAPYRTERRPMIRLEWSEGEPPRSSSWPEPYVAGGPEGKMSIGRRDFSAELDGNGGVLVTRRDAMALDSFLRVLLSELLPVRGGVLVHAAAIDGRLFPGRSGAGKSTLASMAPRRRVLSDEVVAVTRCRSGFELRGTPFWGGFAKGTNAARRDLKGICFLDRRRREEIRRIDRAEAAALLLACVLCFSDAADRMRGMLEIAGELVGSVPCYSLSYERRGMDYATLNSRIRGATG